MIFMRKIGTIILIDYHNVCLLWQFEVFNITGLRIEARVNRKLTGTVISPTMEIKIVGMLTTMQYKIPKATSVLEVF